MEQKLYIDNVLMDVNEDTKITLSMHSNLLRDVSELTGNSTYTIQLPLTAKNREAIDAADVIAHQSVYPYTRHTAKYIRDGITIIDDALAVVVSIGEAIEVLLTWGINAKLTQLISNNVKLNDFQEQAYLNFWNPYSSYTWGTFIASTSNYFAFYAHSDWNKPLDNNEDWNDAIQHGWVYTGHRPCARVPWVLYLIAQEYGITLSFPNESQDLLKVLCIPLVSDKPTDYTLQTDTITLADFVNGGNGRGFVFKVTNPTGDVLSQATTEVIKLTTSGAKDITVTFDFTCYVDSLNAMEFINAGGHMYVVPVTDTPEIMWDNGTAVEFEIVNNNGNYWLLRCRGSVDVALLAAGYGVQFYINADTDAFTLGAVVGEMMTGALSSTITFSISDSADHVQYGDKYPIAQNLPDISIVDFIRTLCVLLGVFPRQMKGDTLYFYPYKKVWENKANAVDWTRRVIPSYVAERPQTLAFSVDGWAQRNLYKWKEVQTSREGFDGEIDIPNTTLEKERVVFELPFAITKTSTNGQSQIPIYQLNNYEKLKDGSETTPTFDVEDCEPVLCTVAPKRNGRYFGPPSADDNNKELQIGTDGLKLTDIIMNKYADLITALASSMIVTERIRISDYELSLFDETIPVYLQQYGRYFAVLDVEASADGTATVKMLALNLGTEEAEPEPDPPTPVLPYDAEVEYLEYDGNQYIDTGVNPNQTIEAEIKFMPTNTNTNSFALIGARNYASNTSNTSYFSLSIWSNGTKIALNDKGYDSGWNDILTLNEMHVAAITGRKLFVDGVQVVASGKTTSFSYTNVTYGLLRNHLTSNNWDDRRGTSGRLYYVKIWKGGALVRDFIPVRVGQIGYLYDQISGNLFGNLGTGNFVLGNDI